VEKEEAIEIAKEMEGCFGPGYQVFVPDNWDTRQYPSIGLWTTGKKKDHLICIFEKKEEWEAFKEACKDFAEQQHNRI
jgi:hypothetical protein